jgi:low affinity Fe/Cu permease
VINTATTVLTFLAVFLIQNTQNRDNEAVQLKLDELIRSHADARNYLIGLENKDEAEVRAIRDAPERALGRTGLPRHAP